MTSEPQSNWRSASEEETRRLGAELARELAPDGVLLLSGDLGAGKTVLAQGVGEGLGIDRREIQSPTYTLVREHRGTGGDLVHMDLYRLAEEDLHGLGLDELLAGPGVKVVEWPDRLGYVPKGALRLRLLRLEGGGRRIERLSNEI